MAASRFKSDSRDISPSMLLITTWPLRPAFALRIAPWANFISTVGSQFGWAGAMTLDRVGGTSVLTVVCCAPPIDAEIFTSLVISDIGESSAASSLLPTASGPTENWSVTSTANSSPARRARSIDSGRISRNFSLTQTINSSPEAWPYESLMSLNRSKSRMRTAMLVSSPSSHRRAAVASESMKLCRFGSLESESKLARWRSFASLSRRSRLFSYLVVMIELRAFKVATCCEL